MQADRVTIFTDGAAQNNPGPAAIGAVVKDERDKTIARISQAIGHATNNQAEYRAVIAALEEAIRLGAKHIRLNSDSELVVRHLEGRYRVKNAALKPLYQQVKQLQSRLESFTVNHIPREQNTEADGLANAALKPT
ncbi:ribonuclease HI family protein [Chloroflexota bacterium]